MEKKLYELTPSEALQRLQAGEEGLAEAEAARRLELHGPNQLAEGKKKSVFRVFAEQFKDLLVVILLVAAAISLLAGGGESTLVIVAVLLLNAALGTVQYFKAERSMESLKALSSPTAKVLRGGERVELPSPRLVPGDIVFLEAGDLVAADGRLLECHSLKVDESSLTGESEPAEKNAAALSGAEPPLGDQKCMVFSGSLVTYGRAVMLVTSTGMSTELGRIAQLMGQTQQRKTPLQKSLDDFSGKLAAVILAICVLVFALSFFRGQLGLVNSLMFAVALAVAAIPEALGSIVTIVLALGTQKMARQNAIMKDLKSVESLGSVSVICSDKTGTLTQNRMAVQQAWAGGEELACADLRPENAVHRRLLDIALLACDATLAPDGGAVGDPTEVALVRWGSERGVTAAACRAAHPRLAELAFDSDRKLMSALFDIEGTPTLYTKGAMDVLLARSTHLLTADGPVPMTEEWRRRIAGVNRAFSEQGLRVLAFGYRPLSHGAPLNFEDEEGYIFAGLVSMMDPPRPESVQAVADAKRGGIRTIMITGDHKVTATAIAGQIGIFSQGDLALDGTELNAMSDAALDEALPRIAVYARVAPEHKIRIVEAWQRRGCVVAMTGDGVNDAPALKCADVGVAMGITGTEVSKDAASMILADDNFATIVKAVVNGRGVFANIKNAVQFLLSGNAAGILAVLYASIAALPAPFAPVHLLFINLLTDSLPAIAIGTEPARPGLLDQLPRDPKRPLLDRPLFLTVLGQGLLIALATMAAFYLGYQGGNAALASTMAFATLALARLFHGFSCRGPEPLFKLGLLSNRTSLLAFGGGVALLAAVLFLPGLRDLFLAVPLSCVQLAQIAGLAFAPTALIQLLKALRPLHRAVKK